MCAQTNASNDEADDLLLSNDGRSRVVLENLRPSVDDGAFAAKRVLGETVEVSVDMFADGHDRLAGVLRWWHEGDEARREAPLVPDVNDVWTGSFPATRLGRYHFTVEGWVDRFETWRERLRKKARAGQHAEVAVELDIGAHIVSEASQRAEPGEEAVWLEGRAAELNAEDATLDERVALGLDEELRRVMASHPDRSLATEYGGVRTVEIDPRLAGFSAWYELFPRSCAPEPGQHGTLRDVIDRLDYVASMGFDVLYLPPIHPIGHTNRKGPNNTPGGGDEGPGSPWAIGSEDGGHDAIHPELGTVQDFVELVQRARERGIEVALDIAFQCSPDHPWVEEHPEWFRWRPDGTVQFAENPPKRYEDIYPLEFESDEWSGLWEALEQVFEVWIERGVRVFRVDNPHTKPLPFWGWVINRIKRRHPETLFLSEAFTRPKVMGRLAKAGFSQSYTYFTWRNTKWELETYLTDLTKTELREYFRPNFWPNTPDILPEVLQTGGRPAFVSRLVLAATLSSNYGIYGPAFELFENRPREPFSEEYLDSEKYQIRDWQIDREDSLRELIARINRVRRGSPALQQTADLTFIPVDNEWIIAYVKSAPRAHDTVLVVVNLDPHHRHAGWLHLDTAGIGTEPDRMFQVHDLLSDARFLWSGSRSYVDLDPQVMPAHLFKIRRRVRTERDFDYFM
jgi:starch synthase (maltosyl-transferring)